MTTKEFAQKAIENGYTGDRCNGWGWIRKNISELDYIFQTEEYKKQDGMEYKCMPFLETEDMSDLEKSAIGTAWYINNERISAQKEKEKQNKLKEKGYITLTGDEKELDGQKINFILDNSGEMFGGMVEKAGKLRWVENRLWAFEKRHTRSGYPIHPNIYIKKVG